MIAIIDDDVFYTSMLIDINGPSNHRILGFRSLEEFYNYCEEKPVNNFSAILVDLFLEKDKIHAVDCKIGAQIKSRDGLAYSGKVFLWTAKWHDLSRLKVAGFDKHIKKNIYKSKDLIKLIT
jgi:hypothetical protein